MANDTFTLEQARPWLVNPPAHSDHKYTRGVLGARTGSAEYPGAAMLSVEAAWRTGLGMVRYLPLELMLGAAVADPLCQAVLRQRPETVFSDGRTDAWVVGSGVSEALTSEHEATFATLFSGSAPLVIDAGAIGAVARIPVSAPAIITPHAGEFDALLRALGITREGRHREAGIEAMFAVAKRLGVTVLLKGAVTHAVTPEGRFGHVGPATGWLATAGTGDVLAGILGALVARHHDAIKADPEALLSIALSAALLHDLAARRASHDGTRPITALDVAEAIPESSGALTEIREL